VCGELENNRRILAGLIYGRREFTLAQILKAYKKRVGTLLVDGCLGVSGYVRFLQENGVLVFMQGKYVVDERALERP
jgi:hypothetical protein